MMLDKLRSRLPVLDRLRMLQRGGGDGPLRSCLCTQAQLESPRFQDWAAALKEQRGRLHRKLWEYCYIAEALDERGMLRSGTRGLGFAVGTEPLASLFASLGVEVLGTDIDAEMAAAKGWIETNQHAAGLEAMDQRGICPPAEFERLCSFRAVDMNDIPADLTGFDFVWSACAFEHLGSIRQGADFVVNSMDCLRPGGVAVHTTEYNCSSNVATVDNADTVIFRKRDIEDIVRRLRAHGHKVDIDYSQGTRPADRVIDVPPYSGDVHLKLKLGDYVCTSIGLIVEKAS